MQEIEQFTNSEFYKFLQKSPTQIVSEVMENFKDAEETSAEAIERLNAEIREQTELLDKLATHANDPVMALRFEREREALVKMNKELVDTIRLSRGATEEQMALFQAFRAGEAASRDMFGGGGGAGGGGNLPRVWHGTDLQGAGIDEDVMNKIEDAIHEETGATKDVRRQVERLDSNIGGYIGNLSSAQSFSFANLNDAIAALGHRVVEAAKINVDPNFRFSGLGGSDPGRSGDSWAGRRYSYKVYPLNIPLDTMGTPAAMQQPIAEAGEAAGTVNVSIMVKPVMEGTRLSAQSAAEIKQAASAGTEAALRAYHGR
jgi:archaellum component FlaC